VLTLFGQVGKKLAALKVCFDYPVAAKIQARRDIPNVLTTNPPDIAASRG
jgi:hypothetical protein